jgi:hypothetical protein
MRSSGRSTGAVVVAAAARRDGRSIGLARVSGATEGGRARTRYR